MMIVIGMHRSGTSATTGALQCLGVNLGGKLYSGHDEVNAKGYFENSAVADTNDEILARIGSSWDDVLSKEPDWWNRGDLAQFTTRLTKSLRNDFSGRGLWAIKDPRVCRMLPYWLPLLGSLGVRPHFLFVIRPADEVHASLKKRDGFSRDKSCLLWCRHYLEAEAESRGYPRAFVSFDRLLEAPVPTLELVESQLALQFPVRPSAAGPALAHFLSRDLRHHRARHTGEDASAVVQVTIRLQELLMELAAGLAHTSDERFDELQRSLDAIEAAFTPLLVEHLRTVAASRGDLQLVVNRLLRSSSYYAGKPIRFVERLFGRMV